MKQLLMGNETAAMGARLARAQVIPVYPITPSTEIMESLCVWQSNGELQAEVVLMESEHSAMAAAVAASSAGTRTFCATSSQGLAYMHEMIHCAAGARAPVVMVNVNRTLAAPRGFWPDHTDSLSQRDTGWLQIYCENNQEILDSIIQSYKIGEKVGLPTLIAIEGIYLSYTSEIVDLPPQEVVDKFLPSYDRPDKISFSHPVGYGYCAEPHVWREGRRSIDAAMQEIPDLVAEVNKEWHMLTGRNYGMVEQTYCDDADVVLIGIGGISGTIKEAVAELRAEGIKAGLLRVRYFRPFPFKEVIHALQGVKRAIIIDRNYSPGNGGILFQEIKSALYDVKPNPVISGYLLGVGGVNVSIQSIKDVVYNDLGKQISEKSTWVI